MDTSGRLEKVASQPQLLLGFFFVNQFWVNDELNRFGVVGVSDPIEIP